MIPHLFVFGPGYTAMRIIAKAHDNGWRVTATCRSDTGRQMLETNAIEAVDAASGKLPGTVGVSHVLVGAAPDKDGDAMLRHWSDWLKQQRQLHSVHYLSSTNVYGDHGGAWVDEDSPTNPSLKRGKWRLGAEKAWQIAARRIDTPLFIYRLAGIYGPDRNALLSLQSGKAHRVIKEGQIFGRIHVDDIAAAVWTAAISNQAGDIFNLADDLPCPPQHIVEAAAKLLNTPPPEAVDFNDANLSPVARSFYAENKRVRNNKIKAELGFQLQYPSYKEGLAALLKDMQEE